MKYEHQINMTNVYNNNLDDCTSRSVRNAWLVLLFTLTLHPPEWMANLKGCTLYDDKNRTNSYDFLRITRVHTLFLSVSFKPSFVDIALVIDMLALSAVFIAMVVQLIFYYFHTVQTLWIYSECFKHDEFFQSVWQTCWIFSECLTNTLNFFRVFGLKKIPLFIFRPL